MGWQADFTLKANLVQRDIVLYETELRRQEKGEVKAETVLDRVFQVLRGIGMTVNANTEAGQQLKAAIKAEWIMSPVCKIETVTDEKTKASETRFVLDGVNVDDLHPGKVRWYGARVVEAYNDAVRIPDPN